MYFKIGFGPPLLALKFVKIGSIWQSNSNFLTTKCLISVQILSLRAYLQSRSNANFVGWHRNMPSLQGKTSFIFGKYKTKTATVPATMFGCCCCCNTNYTQHSLVKLANLLANLAQYIPTCLSLSSFQFMPASSQSQTLKRRQHQ